MWRPVLRLFGITIFVCQDCGAIYLRRHGHGHRRLWGRSCRLHMDRL